MPSNSGENLCHELPYDLASELLALKHSSGVLVQQAAIAFVEITAHGMFPANNSQGNLDRAQRDALLADNVERLIQLQARIAAWRAQSAAQKPDGADAP
jgi:hypothetical protein